MIEDVIFSKLASSGEIKHSLESKSLIKEPSKAKQLLVDVEFLKTTQKMFNVRTFE